MMRVSRVVKKVVVKKVLVKKVVITKVVITEVVVYCSVGSREGMVYFPVV